MRGSRRWRWESSPLPSSRAVFPALLPLPQPPGMEDEIISQGFSLSRDWVVLFVMLVYDCRSATFRLFKFLCRETWAMRAKMPGGHTVASWGGGRQPPDGWLATLPCLQVRYPECTSDCYPLGGAQQMKEESLLRWPVVKPLLTLSVAMLMPWLPC